MEFNGVCERFLGLLKYMYLGVPMFWTAALAVVVDTSASPFIFDKPKSVILATNGFVLMRMFCGFKSQ